MAITLSRQGNLIVIGGQTFPVKDRIKALGARFNGDSKTWSVAYSEEALTALEAINGGAGVLRPKLESGEVFSAPSRALAPVEEALNMPPWALDEGEIKEITVELPAPPPPTPVYSAEPPTLTIAEVASRAGFAIDRAFAGGVWVSGEIENVSRKGPHCFLNLAEPKDEGSKVSAVTVKATLWGDAVRRLAQRHGAETLNEVLQDGLKVRVFCEVSLFRDRCQVSLKILDIDPTFTKGSLALAREQLLKKLRAEGLEDANRKIPMSPFPFVVGLITAEGSRAASDFLDQLMQGGFPGEIVFAPTPMQGENVPLMVATSVTALCDRGVDIVVVSRGGGSASDLRWFDAPEIAYAICRAGVPVVAAIGHHDDTCVAELIAHRREKTPTAAAEFILSIFASTRARVDAGLNSLSIRLSRKIDQTANHHRMLRESLLSKALHAISVRRSTLDRLTHVCDQLAIARLTRQLQVVSRLAQDLHTKGTERLFRCRESLLKFERELVSRDPKPWFAKGWTQLSHRGKPVASIKEISEGDRVSARLADGALTLSVETKKPMKLRKDFDSTSPNQEKGTDYE